MPPIEEMNDEGSVADVLRAAMQENPVNDAPADTGPRRDEAGRFAAAEAVAEAAEEPQDAHEPEEGAAEPTSEEGAVEPVEGQETASEDDDIEPPAEWSLEEQTKFRKLPADAQKLVLEKTAAANERVAEATQAGQRYQALDSMLKERRDTWARMGLDETAAVRRLLALSDYASTRPADFIRDMARDAGVDLAELAGVNRQEADPDDPLASDPAYQAMQAKLAAVERQLEQQAGSLQSREQMERQRAEQQIDTEIATFQSEADEKGNPKHPYFTTVKRKMAALMNAGEAADLKTAYDMACRADPDVWAKIEAASKARAEREEARKRREKAAAAGKAGSSISGSPSGRSEPQQTGDLREDLRAAFAERGLNGTHVI